MCGLGPLKISAVIFDKDGVLISSFNTVYTAMNKTLEHYGFEKLSREEFRKEWWGIRADLSFEKKLGIIREEALEVFEFYKQRRKDLEYMTELYPGVIDILRELGKYYSLGVVTSTFRNTVLELLEDFGISEFFDVVVGGDETTPKPAPDSILKACERLGIKPEEAAYVGDTDADIGAGKSAGCTTVIVTTSKIREELEKVEGIIIIDSLHELKEVINKKRYKG